MTSQSFFEMLEKKIITTIRNIENGKVTPADSGIGKLLNTMKDIDEPCYDQLLSRYKKVYSTLKKD